MAKHAFITKPEDNVRMEPKDEYTHEPEAAINFNESAYYNIYDGEQKVGGWFRIGNRVNEGYAEVSICLYFPDGTAGFMFQKPASPATMPLKPAALASILSSPIKNSTSVTRARYW